MISHNMLECKEVHFLLFIVYGRSHLENINLHKKWGLTIYCLRNSQWGLQMLRSCCAGQEFPSWKVKFNHKERDWMAAGMTGKGHGMLLVKHCGTNLSLMAKVKCVEPAGGPQEITFCFI